MSNLIIDVLRTNRTVDTIEESKNLQKYLLFLAEVILPEEAFEKYKNAYKKLKKIQLFVILPTVLPTFICLIIGGYFSLKSGDEYLYLEGVFMLLTCFFFLLFSILLLLTLLTPSARLMKKFENVLKKSSNSNKKSLEPLDEIFGIHYFKGAKKTVDGCLKEYENKMKNMG